jgi:anti-sigma regulatory factor (Ser/Thr protein kinase)
VNRTDLDKYLLEEISKGIENPAASAARRFRISRQAVNKRLRILANRDAIHPTGSTRARAYSLVVAEVERDYVLGSGLEEHEIWREFARPTLNGIPVNVLGVCEYGFTEMVNNAIDHSEGGVVTCRVRRSAIGIELMVMDNGVGILKKLKDFLNLDDERHAVLELSKGKLTTDPARHTGEGIFFSSRMFDSFSILSGSLYFAHRPDNQDWLLEDSAWSPGTMVQMTIDPESATTTREVMDRYSALGDDYLFTITHVPVGLARYGDENLVSRSQAKRLMSRVERFREVVLDFAGVNSIGQAFADEIFRVFQQQHPSVKIRWFHATPEVESMIGRAIAERDSSQLQIFDSPPSNGYGL